METDMDNKTEEHINTIRNNEAPSKVQLKG